MGAVELKDLLDAARASGGVVVVEETTRTYRFDFGSEQAEEQVTTVARLPAPETALEAAERASAPMRVDEWAKVLVGIPEAELKRAVKKAGLPAQAKGVGADHNALVLEPADVIRYVKLCEQVQAGEVPPPQWWNSVRKQGNGAIRI